MPEIRVKASCAPCRQRKSKCDAQSPCSSCTLRGTQDSCVFPTKKRRGSVIRERDTPKPRSHPHPHPQPYPSSSSNDPSPRLQGLPPPPSSKRSRISSIDEHAAEASSAPTRRALAEINRLKRSIQQLEENIRDISSAGDGLEQVGPPATPEEQKNWEIVKAAVPERVVVEVLLEYMVTECDWLWHSCDLVALWQAAIARGGCSSAVAGLLCMSVAFPALFLGREPAPLYRIPIDASRIHFGLYTTAQSFVTSNGTLDELELLMGIIFYSIYLGQMGTLMESTRIAMRLAIDGGWTDESRDNWLGLSEEERAIARRLVGTLLGTSKWQPPWPGAVSLDNVLINICRPSFRPVPAKLPISLALPGRRELPFRVARFRAQEELDRIVAFRECHAAFPDVIAQMREYQIQVLQMPANPRPEEHERLMSHCDTVHRAIAHWREVRLPAAGFPFIRAADIDLTSPNSCQHAAQSLLNHHAMGHIDAVILRHWLDIDVGQIPSSALHPYLHAECLANAERSMDTIPTLRALLTTRYAPFVTSFAAGNLFNAATCFAIPVLRAVHLWSSQSQEEDIRLLPAWPDDHDIHPRSHSHPTTADSVRSTLPATIYIDSKIKRYANNMLVILDVLSILKASPLEELAEARLGMLIQKYGLRDSQAFPFHDHTPPSAQAVGATNGRSDTITGPSIGFEYAGSKLSGLVGAPAAPAQSHKVGIGASMTMGLFNPLGMGLDGGFGTMPDTATSPVVPPRRGQGHGTAPPAGSRSGPGSGSGSGAGAGAGPVASTGTGAKGNAGRTPGALPTFPSSGTKPEARDGKNASTNGTSNHVDRVDQNPTAGAGAGTEGIWNGQGRAGAEISFGAMGTQNMGSGMGVGSGGDQSFWDELFNVDPGIWEGLLNDSGAGAGAGAGVQGT